MAGTLTVLISNHSETNGTGYQMGSATYTAGRLYIVAIRNRRTAAASESPTSISLGNASNTWVKPTNAADWTYDNTNREYMTTWFMVCAVTETIDLKINFTNTQLTCSWHISEGIGFDTRDINQLIVQGKTLPDQATLTPSLAFNSGFSNAANCTYAVMDYSAVGTAQSMTADPNMIELGSTKSSGVQVGYFHTQWKASAEATVDWTKSSTTISSHYIAELKVLVPFRPDMPTQSQSAMLRY